MNKHLLKIHTRFLFIVLVSGLMVLTGQRVQGQKTWGLALHGGAGVMNRENYPAERQQEYLYHLEKALMLGDSVLRNGGTSVEAVLITVSYLELCPLFNAGKGAVYTWQGRNELDASIMEGKTLQAGAVAGSTRVKHPILAAHAVMVQSPHVLLSGKGVTQFARLCGLEIVPNRYFHTRERHEALVKMKKQSKGKAAGTTTGTVGCVALDQFGNLCAGTSTGGMTGKRYGRIGDTPLIGAGTFADNRTCAVSCTGHGEYFIRLGTARDIAAQMEYLGIGLAEAAATAVKKLTAAGGTGGLIAIDNRGTITLPFNTPGMFRGFIKSTGEKEIAIFEP